MKTALEKFLRQKIKEIRPQVFNTDLYHVCYTENISSDALTGDWLANGNSYIWKIGVLAATDQNKCDFVRVFIAHERKPNRFDYIGELYWQDGENDDIGRSLARYISILENMHPVFEQR